MAAETEASGRVVASETAPMSPGAMIVPAAAAATAGRRGGWLRRIVSRDYLPGSRRWRLRAAAATGGTTGGAGFSSLTSTLSRLLRWKRLSSLSLRSGSASAALDAVTFRVMYVVEAVVLGLALSCFFLCCGCHL